MTHERQKVIEVIAESFYEQNDPGGWKDLDLESKLGCRCAAEGALDALRALPDPLRNAAREVDDLLRRLSEWDMLYVSPEGKPVTADGPYWQEEIARARDQLRAALNEEGERT